MPRVLKLNIYPVQHAKWFRRIMRMAGVRLCFTELASPRQNTPSSACSAHSRRRCAATPSPIPITSTCRWRSAASSTTRYVRISTLADARRRRCGGASVRISGRRSGRYGSKDGTASCGVGRYAISGKAGLHTSELLNKRQLDGCLWASAVGLPNLPVHTAPENDASDLMTSLR